MVDPIQTSPSSAASAAGAGSKSSRRDGKPQIFSCVVSAHDTLHESSLWSRLDDGHHFTPGKPNANAIIMSTSGRFTP
jgi:hypothetical protein